MSELVNLDGIGPVHVERYAHGGGRVWREDEDGFPDLVMDIYEPGERRDAIIERLSSDHAAALAAKDERIKELEKVERVARRIVRDAPHTDAETLRVSRVRVDWTNNAQQIEDLRAVLPQPAAREGGE